MNEYDMTWDEMTLYSIALQHITLHDICMYIYRYFIHDEISKSKNDNVSWNVSNVIAHMAPP